MPGDQAESAAEPGNAARAGAAAEVPPADSGARAGAAAQGAAWYHEQAVRLVLWRHGQTLWNVEGRFQGQSDIPLDEVGEQRPSGLPGC